MKDFKNDVYYECFQKIINETNNNLTEKRRLNKILKKHLVVAIESKNENAEKLYKTLIKVLKNSEDKNETEDLLKFIFEINKEFYEELIKIFIKTYDLYKFFTDLDD